MGRLNVIAVQTFWPHLSHRQMRLLCHMAAMSLDPPGYDGYPPYLYWASWQQQAAAMGWRGVKDDDLERMTRRVRSELLVAGAIRLETASRKGRGPCWEVITAPDLGGP